MKTTTAKACIIRDSTLLPSTRSRLPPDDLRPLVAREAFEASFPSDGDGQGADRLRAVVLAHTHLRKQVWSVAHGPYRSGTSRQAVPVRNFHTNHVQYSAVAQPLPTPQRQRQQRSDELPFGARQLAAMYHATMIHQGKII